MMGVAKFLVNRDMGLRLDFDDPRESFQIRGKFIRSETVEGRKELIALAILFDESQVPMGYKIRLNDFLSQTRAAERGGEEGAQKAAGAAKPAKAAAPPAAAPGGAKPAEAPKPTAAAAAPAAPAAESPAPEPPETGAPASEDFNLEFNKG
jgi:hypothetical protein